MKKRTGLLRAILTLVLLGSQPASAEAFKNTSMGEVLWAIFLFAAGIPMAIGGGSYALVWALRGHRPNLLLTVTVTVSAWWAGLLLAGGEGFFERLWLPALLAVGTALTAAFVSAQPQEPPSLDEFSQG